MTLSSANRTAYAGAGFGVIVAAAVVAFLLSITSLIGSAASRLAVSLSPRLGGDMTIAVWGQGLESADAATARALEVLAVQPGVRRVVALEPDVSDPIVGELIAGRSLGMDGPRLLSVREILIPSPTTRLRKLLSTNGLVTTLDDHHGLSGALERRLFIWGGVAAMTGVTLCGIFVVFCFAQGRAEVALNDKRFDLIVRLGARLSFIGAQVGARLGVLALAGALAGVAFAVGGQTILNFSPDFWRDIGWLQAARPELRDAIWDAFWLLVLPGIAMLGGNIGAQLAVTRLDCWP